MASTSARGSHAGPGWLRVVAALIAACFATPFVYLLVENLTADGGALTFLTKQAWGPLLRSVVLATGVAIGSTIVGVGAAWLVTRTDVPGRKLWRVLLPLPLVIPSFIGAFVLLATFAPGGFLEVLLRPFGFDRIPSIRGIVGSLFVLTLFTYPYVYLLVAARMRQLPSSIEESARLLGAGAWRTFFSIVLPQARSSVYAGGLLVFLYSISDFGVVQLMRYDALTRTIYSTRVFDRPTSLALSLQLGILALAVVVVERSITAGPRQVQSARASSPLELKLGRARWLGAAALAFVVGLALIVPVAVLAYWAIRGLASGSTSGFLVPGSIGGPILNTTFVSVVAAAVAVLVVLPVAYLTVRHRSRVGDGTNAVVVAGFALPGLAIALSLVYLTVSSSIFARVYQTLTLLLVAYVVHFGAQAMRAAQVALAGVPLAVEDAARVLGVRRWQRFLRVELPLMRPGLLAGGGLVMLNVMKELPATLLLAPAGFKTLAMKTWQATESAAFSDAAIAALTLIALSGVLTWVLVIRRSDVIG